MAKIPGELITCLKYIHIITCLVYRTRMDYLVGDNQLMVRFAYCS